MFCSGNILSPLTVLSCSVDVCVPTCVCRQSTQIFPVLMTCLTESVLVPYRFFSNSPDSISFPGNNNTSLYYFDTVILSLEHWMCYLSVWNIISSFQTENYTLAFWTLGWVCTVSTHFSSRFMILSLIKLLLHHYCLKCIWVLSLICPHIFHKQPGSIIVLIQP